MNVQETNASSFPQGIASRPTFATLCEELTDVEEKADGVQVRRGHFLYIRKGWGGVDGKQTLCQRPIKVELSKCLATKSKLESLLRLEHGVGREEVFGRSGLGDGVPGWKFQYAGLAGH